MSNNKLVIKRFYKNQFNVAYNYDTQNDNYKQLQQRLYKLGYDVKINGDFSRLNVYDSIIEFNRDTYKFVYDWNGLTYYTLYKLLFDIEKKIEEETDSYDTDSYCNYSFLKSRNDFETDINIIMKNRKKTIFLNPMDEYGEMICSGIIRVLNYYKTNYIDCKQTNFKESQKDRVNRILEYVDRNKDCKNPIVINIGRSIDYNSSNTLLRGINIYNNNGVINNNYKTILTYSKYITSGLNKKLHSKFEYIMHEQNNILPLLKNFNDIPSIQLELGYKNNPIDFILQNNPEVIKYLINTISFAIQRIVNYNISKRYTDIDNITLIN